MRTIGVMALSCRRPVARLTRQPQPAASCISPTRTTSAPQRRMPRRAGRWRAMWTRIWRCVRPPRPLGTARHRSCSARPNRRCQKLHVGIPQALGALQRASGAMLHLSRMTSLWIPTLTTSTKVAAAGITLASRLAVGLSRARVAKEECAQAPRRSARPRAARMWRDAVGGAAASSRPPGFAISGSSTSSWASEPRRRAARPSTRTSTSAGTLAPFVSPAARLSSSGSQASSIGSTLSRRTPRAVGCTRRSSRSG
mmetsp:Transcript_57990/g.151155  ORF Transcript_57990/g.151155 Transcript_57990/m.151155 type:complete len:255 (-) Transcript_57990:435-1199(-)